MAGWNAYEEIKNEDRYAFSARPAGRRNDRGETYNSEGYNAFFWSSTENESDRAYYMVLYYDDDFVYLDNYYKNNAFSVRCIKNRH